MQSRHGNANPLYGIIPCGHCNRPYFIPLVFCQLNKKLIWHGLNVNYWLTAFICFNFYRGFLSKNALSFMFYSHRTFGHYTRCCLVCKASGYHRVPLPMSLGVLLGREFTSSKNLPTGHSIRPL